MTIHTVFDSIEQPITDTTELAELACRCRRLWGVYCSWTGMPSSAPIDNDAYAARQEYIKSCLPPKFVFSPEFSDGWFLQLFETEIGAREFYNQCQGDDQNVHDGVYAMLIDNCGKTVTANT